MNSEQSTIEQQAPSVPILALNAAEAARCLGICRTTLWRLTATGKIRKTSYGKIPITELQRHLAAETSVAEVRRTR